VTAPAPLGRDSATLRSGFALAEDGQPLYWRSAGDGALALVCCNGAGVSTFFFKYLVQHFRPRCRVVVWDYRGHGRSPPPPEPIEHADLGVERAARDLAFVLRDAAVGDRVVLVGHSMGVQVALESVLRQGRPAEALVSLFGTCGRPVDTFLDQPFSRPVFDALVRAAERGGRLWTRLALPIYGSPLAFSFAAAVGLLDPRHAPRQDIGRYLEHLAAMDPRVFLRMVSQIADHDADDLLPEVAMPVLVIAGERDRFTPLHRSVRMAERIPNAELTVIPDGTHAAIVEHPDLINARITRFLRDRLTDPPFGPGLTGDGDGGGGGASDRGSAPARP
jgi:pimeloyl-ACP methyl ester carboxylesterase